MNTSNQISNAADQSNTRAPRSISRKTIFGVSVAVIGAAALILSTAGTSQVPANLAASSIEGNIIVAFDMPSHAAKNTQYRIDCSAVSESKMNAWAQASASPVVVSGLATGEQYDCRASMNSDASTSKPVRVRVLGAD